MRLRHRRPAGAPPGVYIAMSGRVFDIDRVRKNREARRFEEIP